MATKSQERMKINLNLYEYFRSRPIWCLIAGVLVILSGFLLSDLPTMIQSQSWPSTTGTVISRRYVGQQFEEYDGDLYRKVDGYIHYQYAVNDESYTSTAVNSIDTLYYPSSTIDQYPKGKEVEVYFNPQRPSQAVLEPGMVIDPKAFGFISSLLSYQLQPFTYNLQFTIPYSPITLSHSRSHPYTL